MNLITISWVFVIRISSVITTFDFCLRKQLKNKSCGYFALLCLISLFAFYWKIKFDVGTCCQSQKVTNNWYFRTLQENVLHQKYFILEMPLVQHFTVQMGFLGRERGWSKRANSILMGIGRHSFCCQFLFKKNTSP